MTKYAVIVGISEYNPKAKVDNLPFAINDATTIARLLRNQRIGQFSETDVTLIINGKMLYIKRKLEELFSNGKRDDLIVVYFSCHIMVDILVSQYLSSEAPHLEDLEKQSINENFNFKNIRTLLTEGFTVEELRRLCYDEPSFRPVYQQSTSDMSGDKVVQILIEYAERKVLIETLLEVVKALNPAKYERHHPYRVIDTSPTIPGSAGAQQQRVDIFRGLYLLTSDSEERYLASTSIDISFINSLMGKSEIGKQILILNAGFSNVVGKDVFVN